MSWTYKHQKLRDALRKRYTEETGLDDYRSPAFEEWLREQGELE